MSLNILEILLKEGVALRRGFRDRDYLQTVEDFYFCVVGNIHPNDRVISYLKYIPSPYGKWSRGENKFQRVMHYYTMLDLMGTIKFLERHPEYLYNSSVMDIRISAVPSDKITVHLKPEERMMELAKMDGKDLDVLQGKTLDLASTISDESGVPLKYFGVTGSILLGIHMDFSDIDLIIYGMKNAERVKETLNQICEKADSQISRFNEEMARQWCLNKTKMYPLTYDEAKHLFARKWGKGIFRGTVFSLHPVKLEDEISEKYGDRTFRPEGMIRIEARVSDDSESEILPSAYRVEDVKILLGPKISDIYEVTSYEGLYSGIASKGEKIMAYGKLERVIDNRSGGEYHRVLVGSQEAKGRDYIKPL
ncbi:hypothetical protein KEJ17_08815 [Candidatus Bathyarchaeota archaeon]|nr:hypothetical protein [Candidatus Bathyarchaeota archaeon]